MLEAVKVLRRGDVPSSLEGVLVQASSKSAVLHQSGCALGTGPEPSDDVEVVSGCVRCANTREVLELVRVLDGARSRLVTLRGQLQSALEGTLDEEGQRWAWVEVARSRTFNDPRWGGRQQVRAGGEVEELVSAAYIEAVTEMFDQEPFAARRTSGKVALVGESALAMQAPMAMVEQVPLARIGHGRARRALVVLGDDEVERLREHEDVRVSSASPERLQSPEVLEVLELVGEMLENDEALGFDEALESALLVAGRSA